MRGTQQKSYLASSKSFQAEWFVVDATDRVLGRLATRIAMVLMGKHKPTYTPFLDTGDFVIVLNAGKIRLTGKKMEKKIFKRFSTYPGGLKEIPIAVELAKHPDEVVRRAVLNMLPRGTLGRQQIDKLKVYAGADHPHQAQEPKPLEIK